MMTRLLVVLVSGLCGLSTDTTHAADYDYPIDNPLAATVVGTPPDQRASLTLPSSLEERRMVVFADRDVPDVFWYADELRYLVALQDHPAPLVFVISGTGADHKTPSAVALASALFARGSHVVTLPSPTQINFIVSAAKHSRPGFTDDDVGDLLRVMTRIRDEFIGEGVEIDGYGITGYSMGAFHAAVVAERDARQGDFSFDHVVMINPPISLYESALRLDAMLLEGIPGGLVHFDKFYEDFMNDLARLYVRDEGLEFAGDFLYRIYEDVGGDVDDNRLKALIGLSFRLMGSNLVFASDVMNHAGYIVPSDLELGITSSLSNYFKVAGRLNFAKYIDELFFPLFDADYPGSSRDNVVEQSSLRAIEDFLRGNPNVYVLHNRDDIILGKDDITWFENVFKDRAHIFANGGHLGNIYHRAFIEIFQEQFANGSGR
ncbi:MAG: hypothetical protein R3C97_11870 [Geminicoccaceae bacterium]